MVGRSSWTADIEREESLVLGKGCGYVDSLQRRRAVGGAQWGGSWSSMPPLLERLFSRGLALLALVTRK